MSSGSVALNNTMMNVTIYSQQRFDLPVNMVISHPLSVSLMDICIRITNMLEVSGLLDRSDTVNR